MSSLRRPHVFAFPAACLSLALALPAASPLHAQVAPSRATPGTPEPTTPPVVLSVFEVSTDKDVGYQAGNTMSGSRLDSSLRDTAAAVTVFTPEFLSDFGASTLAEIVAYSANVAVDMLETSADANPTFVTGSDFPDTRIVVRGLQASTSMDFFEGLIQVDNYNTERVELASGPNSILFGFGSPGGLVNLMTKRAQLQRHRSAVRTQFGEWGFRRAELDHNQVLLPGRLAVRFNGLLQDTAGWRRWDFNHTDRGAVSIRAQPWGPRTTVQANYETGQWRAHVLLPMTAFDANALWLANGRRTLSDAAWTTVNRGQGINRNTAVRNLVVTDAAGSAPYVLTTRNAVNFRLLEATFEDVNVPATQRAGLTMAPFSEVPFDTSVFGPGAVRDTNFDRLLGRIEHRFTPALTAEFAYVHERTKQWVISPTNNLTVYGGDPNTVIPNPDGVGAPVANPHAGRAYLEAQWKTDDGRTGQDVWRAALAFTTDRGRWGNHHLAVMAEHGVQFAWRHPGREIFVDEQGVPIGNADAPENNTNFITRRHYFAPGRFDTYITGNPDDAVTVSRNGRTYRRAWVYQNVAGGSIRRTMDSVMAVTQSAFFARRLVVTAGLRQDILTFDSYGNSRLGADHPLVRSGQRVRNSLTFTPEIAESLRYRPLTGTAGAVFHVTPWLSLFGNTGNNRAQPKLNTVILPDETLPPPAEGTTLDAGFALTLLDGRLYTRVTGFQTAQNKAAGGNFNINIRGGTYDLVTPTNRILDTLAANNRLTPAEQLAHTIGDESNLSASSDIVNRGIELSTWLNLTKNLTGVVNFSYTKTDRSNVFPEFETWFERERAFWLRTPGADSLVHPTANTTIAQDVAALQQLTRRLRDFYNFGFGERPLRANASGRYTFTQGRLRGAFAGGGVRWQGRVKLDRVIEGTRPDGTEIYGRLLHGPEDFKMDAFVGYRRRATVVGRACDLTFQINVTNLTNEDEIMPMRLNDHQSGYLRLLFQDPRRVRGTVSIAF